MDVERTDRRTSGDGGKFERVAFDLRKAIVSGDLPAGMALPGTTKLAAQRGVAPQVLGRVLRALGIAGYLERSGRHRGTKNVVRSKIQPIRARAGAGAAHRIASALVEEIERGRLPAGKFIRVKWIAQRYGVTAPTASVARLALLLAGWLERDRDGLCRVAARPPSRGE